MFFKYVVTETGYKFRESILAMKSISGGLKPPISGFQVIAYDNF